MLIQTLPIFLQARVFRSDNLKQLEELTPQSIILRGELVVDKSSRPAFREESRLLQNRKMTRYFGGNELGHRPDLTITDLPSVLNEIKNP